VPIEMEAYGNPRKFTTEVLLWICNVLLEVLIEWWEDYQVTIAGLAHLDFSVFVPASSFAFHRMGTLTWRKTHTAIGSACESAPISIFTISTDGITEVRYSNIASQSVIYILPIGRELKFVPKIRPSDIP
jgi:hypothetical protein